MRLAILALILIFLFDLVFGLGFKFYRYQYFDMSLHFLGGFFVAMFFTNFLNSNYADKSLSKAKISIFSLIIVSTTLFVGVFWEFLEYLVTVYYRDYLLQKYSVICCIGNLDDTIGDLVFDITGALIFVLIYLIYSKSSIKVNKG